MNRLIMTMRSTAGNGVEMTNWRKRKSFRARLLIAQGGKCFYCHVLLTSSEEGLSATLDHLTPLSKGGLDVLSNFVLSCKKCNGAKGALPLERFLRQ